MGGEGGGEGGGGGLGSGGGDGGGGGGGGVSRAQHVATQRCIAHSSAHDVARVRPFWRAPHSALPAHTAQAIGGEAHPESQTSTAPTQWSGGGANGGDGGWMGGGGGDGGDGGGGDGGGGGGGRGDGGGGDGSGGGSEGGGGAAGTRGETGRGGGEGGGARRVQQVARHWAAPHGRLHDSTRVRPLLSAPHCALSAQIAHARHGGAQPTLQPSMAPMHALGGGGEGEGGEGDDEGGGGSGGDGEGGHRGVGGDGGDG